MRLNSNEPFKFSPFCFLLRFPFSPNFDVFNWSNLLVQNKSLNEKIYRRPLNAADPSKEFRDCCI